MSTLPDVVAGRQMSTSRCCVAGLWKLDVWVCVIEVEFFIEGVKGELVA